MKNTQHACALAAVLLLYSVTASADAPKLKPADCEAVRGFSQDLMMGRQSGFKMEGMMKGIPAGEQHNPMRQMVKEAYEEPQYKTRADQERAASASLILSMRGAYSEWSNRSKFQKRANNSCPKPLSGVFFRLRFLSIDRNKKMNNRERFSRRFGHQDQEAPITVREDAPDNFRAALVQIAYANGYTPKPLRDVVCRS